MPVFVLTAVPLAPALAAILVALRVVHGDAAVARCVVGAAAIAVALATLGIVSTAPPLSALVAFAIGLIALVVSSFAARSMSGGSVAYAPFFALLAAATAGSLGIAVASDLRVLAAAWIATGLFTSGLLAAARTRSAARRWAVRHLAIERIGDLAWIAVLFMTWRAYHTFDLATLAHAVVPSYFNTAIAVTLVVVGITRSALVPFHEWLPNSMEAPTAVSAFMHAGLVNGAGVLLAKTAFFIVLAPSALTLAAVLGGITAALGGTITLVRPETKRRLGWSTVAQMGFMVLQCGCGAFAAAVVHLVAHGGYKSAAFLGAAGSIDNHKRAGRRATGPATELNAAVLALSALAPATLGVAIASMLLHHRLVELPAATMVLAIAWAAGTSGARRCAEGVLDTGARVAAFCAVAGAVTTYLVCVTAVDGWLGPALPHFTFAPATAIVAGFALASGLFEGLGVRPRVPDAFYTLALIEGRATRLEAAA